MKKHTQPKTTNHNSTHHTVPQLPCLLSAATAATAAAATLVDSGRGAEGAAPGPVTSNCVAVATGTAMGGGMGGRDGVGAAVAAADDDGAGAGPRLLLPALLIP